jgi:iron complex transport system ATP-binding protein
MLEVRSLVCGYDSRFFLKDVCLDVGRGELLGVIGPNGSGKTTLIRAISRVLKPVEGEVLLEGRNIWEIDLREFARKVAVVSQETQMGFTKVQDYVLLGRIPHYRRFQFLETKRDLGVVERAMSMTGILHLKDRFLRDMSGGERRLAIMARALAQEPEVLLLDEPVAHLDITHQIAVLDLVKKLNREWELTVVVVLHELNLASEFCERLLLLDRGEVYRVGSPEEVLTGGTLKEVYGADVLVEKHPVSSRPHVLVVSGEVLP